MVLCAQILSMAREKRRRIMGEYKIEERANSGYWEIAPRGELLFHVYFYPEPDSKAWFGVASTRKGAENLIKQFKREDREEHGTEREAEERIDEIARSGGHLITAVNWREVQRKFGKSRHRTGR
jgi:hypothetical protein